MTCRTTAATRLALQRRQRVVRGQERQAGGLDRDPRHRVARVAQRPGLTRGTNKRSLEIAVRLIRLRNLIKRDSEIRSDLKSNGPWRQVPLSRPRVPLSETPAVRMSLAGCRKQYIDASGD